MGWKFWKAKETKVDAITYRIGRTQYELLEGRK